jgi:hypothetical protein
MEVIAVLAAIVIFDLAAVLWGFDSRHWPNDRSRRVN